MVRDGISFLKRTQRTDGSWPIDIDLSTWVTTLAVKSVKNHPEVLSSEDKVKLTDHLLAIQNRQVHPFNGTQPGGWGWTTHSGSVPDGDDTPGAVLALIALNEKNPERIKDAVLAGCNWLLQLQNSDGGMPTFSRGWGKLPFDQSCADLTGHAVLALAETLNLFQTDLKKSEIRKLRNGFVLALKYLRKQQNANGYWLPLWFGNQSTAGHTNPVYGTARVTAYLNEALNTVIGKEYAHIIGLMVKDGCRYLASVQNADGSWGGAEKVSGSIEETALAVTALSASGYTVERHRGLEWLAQKTKSDGLVASPIGLYFASLWYDEEMYPLTAYLECLSAIDNR